MTDLTIQQLRTAMPQATTANLQRFIGPLNETMRKYCITTPLRQAHFLCQIAWESGQLRYTEEIASGAAISRARTRHIKLDFCFIRCGASSQYNIICSVLSSPAPRL